MDGTFIINADDLGLSRGATLGIIRSHLEGIVTSASLSPTGLDYKYAVQSARELCPDLGIGLHFTLSAGKPVSRSSEVPLLIDKTGNFRWEFISLLRNLRLRRSSELLEQIGVELEAQIQKLKANGIQPDHINSERHVHLIPGIFDKVVQAANRHQIPFVRGGKDISLKLLNVKNFKPAVLGGGILKYLLLQGLTLLNNGGYTRVGHCSTFASYMFTGRLDLVLNQILQTPHRGVMEIMVHPGVPEESEGVDLGNPGLARYLVSGDRQRELEACIRALPAKDHVEFHSFRSLAAV